MERTLPAGARHDLTDAQWAILAPLLPPRSHRGRPTEVDLRAVLNAIFYVLRTGCQWRYLPPEFPKWQTVYWYWARWVNDGTLVRINDTLRRQARVRRGRQPEPSAAVLDSQTVKTTERGASAALTAAS